jgi:hypothetical protein
MPHYTVYKLVLEFDGSRPSLNPLNQDGHVKLYSSHFIPQGLVQAATAEDALAQAKRLGHFAPAVELWQGGLQ